MTRMAASTSPTGATRSSVTMATAYSMVASTRPARLPNWRRRVWTLTPASRATSSREMAEIVRVSDSSKNDRRMRRRVSSAARARVVIV